mmetsp:Transcript_3605/g.11018  ORF Transcript_3605/g.11018 Transcript_3605/m.11018 type:complete len:337 (+) Transcript_3605:80-1090(+)
MATLFLVHAALVTGALSLAMVPGADEELAVVSLAEESDAGAERHWSVPPIGRFARLWARRYGSEEHLQGPMPSSIQLVLGLFTVAPDAEYREVVRGTWLRQAGVCYWRRAPKEGCSVYVAFVVGRSGVGEPVSHGEGERSVANMSAEEVERTHGEEGMLVLDTPENLNGNKSLVWFDTARRLFPWATHVGKTDMDTYPLLHKLVRRMEAGAPCSRRHGPYEVIGRPHAGFGPRFEHGCQSASCPQFVSWQDERVYVARPGQPWNFLSGEFYVLSMPLVRQVDWTERGPGGSEDLQVTRRVGKAAGSHNFCVVLRRLDSWYHRNRLSNASYANDLAG